MTDKLLTSKKVYGSKRDHLVDDDFIDRLNSRWTVRILIMCIFVVSGNMLWLKNILCWTPNEFATTHIEYANSVCWLQGSYYLPTEEIEIPDRSKERTHFISYYQWTPFILLGMAFLFLLPRFSWHTFPGHRGMNIKRLVFVLKEKTEEEKGIQLAKLVLKSYLDLQFETDNTLCCLSTVRKCHFGYTVSYLIIKILYFINSLTQFLFLNSFLSFEFTSYGFRSLLKMFSGKELFESPTFPRVTMCDFMVRRLGSNQHWYSVQCNLPFNMYNEKIFLGIWLWLLILTILNFISIIVWLILLSPPFRFVTINGCLEFAQAIKEIKTDTIIRTKEYPHGKKSGESRLIITEGGNRMYTTGEDNGVIIKEQYEVKVSREVPGRDVTVKEVRIFLDYLQMDGYLFFVLIKRNTDEVTAAKILKHLYDKKPADRPDRPDRSARPVRPDRSDRPDRPDLPDRSDHSDRFIPASSV